MAHKPKLRPGPNHPITVTPYAGRIKVLVDGKVLAETTEALTLQESTYPAVRYIPRQDVDLGQLERTEHSTYCPFKGDASYYSIPALNDAGENAVWTYETPYDAVADIKDHLAFYPDRVELIED
ncbi:DUF427 domain-containing protein [Kribbella deserti]|uniref:DUF427 domain-containing protein n=1 Tax=Kribbella deserti TaxID=1926257 RepID=A0ABV6QW96_9ACTN